MSTNYLIYKATSKTSKKSYIGKTSYAMSIRRSQHKWEALNSIENGMHFHKAIRKYGIDDFEWRVIFRSNNWRVTSILEMELIEYHQTQKEGYNIIVKDSFSATPNTKLSRERDAIQLRNLEREKMQSRCLPETRERIGNSNRGKKRTKEQKENISRGRTKYFYRFFSPIGGVYVTKSLKRFCYLFGIPRGGAYNVADKLNRTIKGWKVERVL